MRNTRIVAKPVLLNRTVITETRVDRCLRSDDGCMGCQSLSDLNGSTLTERICAGIKWTGEMHSWATDETGRVDNGANPTVPFFVPMFRARTSMGFQAAAAQFVGRLVRSSATPCVALLLALRAA